MTTMPRLNTNLEFGRNENSGRIVLSLPPQAVSVHYLRRAAETHGAPVLDTIEDTASAALKLIGDDAARCGAERDVPLLIWRTRASVTWRQTPYRLSCARLLWAWSPPPAYQLLAWAMRVETVHGQTQAGHLLIAQPGCDDVAVNELPTRVTDTPP